MIEACDNCGLITQVSWMDDPPGDLEPGGYCHGCLANGGERIV